MTIETQLRSVFFYLCGRLGIETPDMCWKILETGYEDKDRFYHTLTHIYKMWLEFNKHVPELDWAEPCEWALFWHDAFYSTHVPPRRNEAISAEMALHPIEHKSPEFKVRVENLIMATCHDQEPTFNDAKYLCDFDLLTFGLDRFTYRDYMGRIRAEYNWVPVEKYKSKRIEILKGFLDRDHIYATNPYREKYEAQARENLQYEIDTLVGED